MFVSILMFTGDIEITYGDTDFQIVASYMDDLTVNYEEVESIEYRETFDIGSREMGYGSARIWQIHNLRLYPGGRRSCAEAGRACARDRGADSGGDKSDLRYPGRENKIIKRQVQMHLPLF